MKIVEETALDDGQIMLAFDFAKGEIERLIFLAMTLDLQEIEGCRVIAYNEKDFAFKEYAIEFKEACELHDISLADGHRYLQLALHEVLLNTNSEAQELLSTICGCGSYHE